MMKKLIDFQQFFKSLSIAFSGLRIAFYQEQSFRLQVLIGILVIILMFYLGLTLVEKAVLVLIITLVLSLELVNSQIERVLDIIRPVIDPRIKIIKDLSAGAVLVSVFGAILIAILIFLPYILSLSF